MARDTEKMLQQKNMTPTSMRILIYDFLKEQQVALSLSEIEGHFYKADRVTIYRTLKTFEEKGIVHSIYENNTTRYILCYAGCSEEKHKDAHLHFYCKVCKQITCKEDFLIPLDVATRYRIDEIKLVAKGVCEHCLQRKTQLL